MNPNVLYVINDFSMDLSKTDVNLLLTINYNCPLIHNDAISTI